LATPLEKNEELYIFFSLFSEIVTIGRYRLSALPLTNFFTKQANCSSFCLNHRFGETVIAGREWALDLELIQNYSPDMERRKFPVIKRLCEIQQSTAAFLDSMLISYCRFNHSILGIHKYPFVDFQIITIGTVLITCSIITNHFFIVQLYICKWLSEDFFRNTPFWKNCNLR
jgi:hypothetical protein